MICQLCNSLLSVAMRASLSWALGALGGALVSALMVILLGHCEACPGFQTFYCVLMETTLCCCFKLD